MFFFLPEFFLLFYILYFLCFALFHKPYVYSAYYNNYLIYIFLLCIFFTFNLELNFINLNVNFLNDLFYFNNFVIILKLFILIVIAFFLLLCVDYFKYERFFIFEFVFIILLSIIGIFFFISANNFFVLYMTLELQSFCFYILCALRRYSALSVEAALRYFILGSFASSIFLFGISIVYGFFGTLNFTDLSIVLFSIDFFYSYFILALVGFFFILIGFFFKLAVVPFHFWIANVYEGSPLIVMLFFSLVPKISFIFTFMYIFIILFNNIYLYFFNIYIFCAFNSILFGTLFSLYQFKIKRLLAFGAITHVGYMILAAVNGSLFGFISLFIYLFVYLISSFGFFSVLISFRQHKTFLKLKRIVDFSLLFRSNFLLGIFVSFFLLSFAGIPPLAGFFGKFYVFMSLIESNNYFLAGLVVLVSFVSVIYYIRLLGLFFLMIKKYNVFYLLLN